MPMYPAIPILSFVSAILTFVPLTWYLRARNFAAVAIGAWLSIVNLTYAVDALLWAENTDVKAAVWCDVSTIFITGSCIALPAACLSICIRLDRLASQTSASHAKRLGLGLFECLVCFGIPVVYIVSHLVVQPRRFDLYYGFGCRPATYPTVATIFLVMIPPLLLTVATIVWAGIAGRHIARGVQFCGKGGSISALTRNSYLRLVGMALLETMFSSVSITIAMGGALSPGLAPIGSMPRDLGEVLTWSSETMTDDIRTMLVIEWSLTVAQSVVFFGLFACRMEVVREGRELVLSLLRLLTRSNPSTTSEQGTLKNSTSTSVPTLPITVVDLSLVIQSASTFTPYDHSMNKALPSTPGASSLSCAVEDGPAEEEIVICGIDPSMMPLESPSRSSAIASSHNSLRSNFDPSQLAFSPDAWPPTPTTIPVRPPRRPFGAGCVSEQGSRFCDVRAGMPTVKSATHDVWTKFPGCEMERRDAIYVTVVKETHF